MLKDWSPAWHYWKVEESLRGEAWWEVLGHWEQDLEGACGG